MLYQRFGPADAARPALHQGNTAATRQAIIGSLALSRSGGERIPLVPVLSLWVFNGRSDSDREAVSPRSIADQLAIVQRAVGVDTILFWSGWETPDEMESADEPVEAIEIATACAGFDITLGAGP